MFIKYKSYKCAEYFLNTFQTKLQEIKTSTATYLFIYKETFHALFSERFLWRKIYENVHVYGVTAIPSIIIIGCFLGAAISFQVLYMLKTMGAQSLVGMAVVRGMMCDFGPIMASTLIAGHAGSAICAELGNLKSTEQLHALVSMSISPIRYIVAPHILSIMIYLPILNAIHASCGILAGRFLSIYAFHISSGSYDSYAFMYLNKSDIFSGLIVKPLIFSIIISSIACVNGLLSQSSAVEISKQSSKTVTYSFIKIILFNFMIIEFFSKINQFSGNVF